MDDQLETISLCMLNTQQLTTSIDLDIKIVPSRGGRDGESIIPIFRSLPTIKSRKEFFGSAPGRSLQAPVHFLPSDRSPFFLRQLRAVRAELSCASPSRCARSCPLDTRAWVRARVCVRHDESVPHVHTYIEFQEARYARRRSSYMESHASRYAWETTHREITRVGAYRRAYVSRNESSCLVSLRSRKK